MPSIADDKIASINKIEGGNVLPIYSEDSIISNTTSLVVSSTSTNNSDWADDPTLTDDPTEITFYSPVREECYICEQNVPLDEYLIRHNCCGSSFCSNCVETMKRREKDTGIPWSCPECRATRSKDGLEEFDRAMINAVKGKAWAQEVIGDFYYYGHVLPQNLMKAFEWHSLSAAQGVAPSQNFISRMYFKGEGVEQNFDLSVKFCKMAAYQGYPSAQCHLANSYYTGDGVIRSYEKAVRYYKLSADQGWADAQFNLAICLNNGEGVQKNIDRALKYYFLAAAQGHTKAYYRLAICHYKGYGMEKDFDKAIKYYTLAAEKGDKNSQFNLALLYKNGEGAQKSLVKSIHWFRRNIRDSKSIKDITETREKIENILAEAAKKCGSCGVSDKEKKLTTCAQCKSIFYCGRDCQTKHWKEGHKEDCRSF